MIRKEKRSPAVPVVLAVLAAALLTAPPRPASANQILLDQPVKAGDLIVFPSLKNDREYYYVSDQVRLARHDNDKPQFSFLRWVDPQEGTGDQGREEAGGGGIVHAVVALSVSEELLRDAQRELQRIRPGATIIGPVIFESGKFALVSSFANAEGDFTEQVVGLGNAPLLDGEKAAVSLQLTQLGSRVLWQSFHSATPDISFSFEMDLEGYQSPKEAVIEADFDRIYQHQSFAAGLASTYLSAEIKAAFDDLRTAGAIRLTQVGEDEDLEKLVTTAYNKLTELMFQPVQGTGTPDLASLAGAAGGQASLLDRATQMLDKGRQEAAERNKEIRGRNERRRKAEAEADEARGRAGDAEERAEAAEQRAAELEQRAARAEAQAESLRRQADSVSSQSGTSEEQRQLITRLVQGSEGHAASLRELARQARAEADNARSQVEPARQRSQQADGALGPDREEEVEAPSFAIVAAYEMKRVRQRGTFRINLNKFTVDTLTLRFDENIGDMTRYLEDEEVFRQVNITDPLYRQREVMAAVDGLNAQDFGEYINFVTINLRKKHQNGQETHDEVRIDRSNFNQEGNRFRMLYGWNGDNDRRRWLDYEYQAHWSFFGGQEIEQEWRSSRAGAINLAPPYHRRQVTLEADPELLADAEVRLVTVKIYYDLGGDEEKVRQESLNVSRNELSKTVDFMLPADELEYDYEITWRLRGNRRVESGRQSTTESILFVDELPAES